MFYLVKSQLSEILLRTNYLFHSISISYCLRTHSLFNSERSQICLRTDYQITLQASITWSADIPRPIRLTSSAMVIWPTKVTWSVTWSAKVTWSVGVQFNKASWPGRVSSNTLAWGFTWWCDWHWQVSLQFSHQRAWHWQVRLQFSHHRAWHWQDSLALSWEGLPNNFVGAFLNLWHRRYTAQSSLDPQLAHFGSSFLMQSLCECARGQMAISSLQSHCGCQHFFRSVTSSDRWHIPLGFECQVFNVDSWWPRSWQMSTSLQK